MNSEDLSVTIVVSVLIIALAAVVITDKIQVGKIGREALKTKRFGGVSDIDKHKKQD